MGSPGKEAWALLQNLLLYEQILLGALQPELQQI